MTATVQQQHSAPVERTGRIADFRVLVVPGLHGSGPEHWQTRWQRLYPAFERVEQEHWSLPDLPVWSAQLQQALNKRSTQSIIIVAHSFGCLTTVHRAAAGADNIAAALLVAPADPEKFNVSDAVQTQLPFPSLVVGSRNDPWMTTTRAKHWAKTWGSDFIDIGAAGHINAESGVGDWIEGQGLLRQLVTRV